MCKLIFVDKTLQKNLSLLCDNLYKIYGDYMIFDKEFKEYGYTDLIAYSGKDITEEMLDDCMKLEKDFYAEEYTQDSENLKTCVLNHNQMCFIFKDIVKNVIVGYSFWFPIKTKVFNAFIKSKYSLLKFEENYFSNYKDKVINLFLASEAYITGYDIKRLHEAVEDIFSRRVLDLAYKGTKIKYIALESCCRFEEEYIVKLLGLTQKVQKERTVFFFDEYSPEKVYLSSKYASGIKQYYSKLNNDDEK